MVGRHGINSLLHPSGSPAMLRVSLFSQALTLIGALTMRWRPGPGFCIFGAGFLVMGAVLLVLLPWEQPLMIPVALLLTLGLVYTGLGWKQLGVGRG